MERKRKRNSHFDVEWTAAKCQRLLRPLTSRIGPLRRLAYITDSQRAGKATNSIVDPGVHTDSAGKSEVGDDPVWFPAQKQKAKISYSTRDRTATKSISSAAAKKPKAQPNVSHDSLIILPTPFKARAQRRGTPVKPGAGLPLLFSNSKRPARPAKRLKKDPFNYAPVSKQSAELHDRQAFEKIFELHQGVQDGFKLLLEKTQPPLQPASRGARSLMNICLRKIPDYIQAEEEWRKSVDQNDETDVTAEVYEELQELSSSPNHGWGHLREVVRAHGIKLVRQIIQDGLVAGNTRSELANMPLIYGTMAEAEDLSLAHAHTLILTRPLDTNSLLFEGCLAALQDIQLFGADRGSADSRIRILNSLYNTGKLRLSWMASRDMARIMSRLVRSLASSLQDVDYALHFIHDRILQACKKSLVPIAVSSNLEGGSENRSALAGRRIKPTSAIKTSFQQTINGLITVLTAIILIERDIHPSEGRQPAGHCIVALLRSIAIAILRKMHHLEVIDQQISILEPNNLVIPVLASMLIVNAKLVDSDPEYVNLTTEELVTAMHKIHNSSMISSNNNRTLSEVVSSFICNLSRCCGQSLEHNSQDFLGDLVQSLLAHSEPMTGNTKSFLKQVALESTIEFARTSRTQESRLLARETERTVQQQGPLQSITPTAKRTKQRASSTQRKGFRWEEGLCEWISATPFTADNNRQRIEATLPLLQSVGRTESPIGLGLSFDGSFDPAEEENDLQDSGYISAMQETPAPSRKRMSALELLDSSPDILDCSISELDGASDQRVLKPKLVHSKSERARKSMTDLIRNARPEITTKPNRAFSKTEPLSRPEPISLPKATEGPRAAVPKASSQKLKAPSREEKKETAQSTSVPLKKAPRLSDPPPNPSTVASSAASSATASKVTVTAGGEQSDSDCDELAMSCKKKPVSRPRDSTGLSKTTGSFKVRQSLEVGRGRFGNKGKAVVRQGSAEDDSEDELGA